ncbi:methyltransferase domain-containing protein [Pseudarthrobacter sp. R1]|uniref:putative RNA methyltransferase n=1 Tax=Pseudarthrobacter sp. R1 TaxID=2944934 RepID=UPI00210B2038|nr:methyltransferase domain-containing protein [Pseudarthrobacter sp. R1]MCQ6270922.1 methyltransferase domain-containing protein [Pseudarthrobacter sp. R1]
MPSTTDLPLLCPVCRKPLERRTTADAGQGKLVCPDGHSFDAARQGYFNLLVGKGTVFEADTADMVRARYDFLAAGHYRPLATAVAAAVVPCLPEERSAVLDAGTGTGHYLRAVLDQAAAQNRRQVAALGVDISKFALRRAARLNPEAVNLVWDVWQPLPLADNSVDAITVIFAPRNAAEFARVLRPGGALVVVTPRSGHLAAIAAAAGMLGIEEGKDARLAEAMGSHFDAETSTDVGIPLALTRPEAADLAYMGPAGHHLDRLDLTERLLAMPEPVRAEARFRLTVFRPRKAAAT